MSEISPSLLFPFNFVEIQRYAHENGCVWEASTCDHAAEGGHLECLKYLFLFYSFFLSPSFPLFSFLFVLLSLSLPPHLPFDCMRYAHENGCKWDIGNTHKAAIRGVEIQNKSLYPPPSRSIFSHSLSHPHPHTPLSLDLL
jgi:hypothetical protein